MCCCKKDKLKPEDYKFYCKIDDAVWRWTDENHLCTECSRLQSDYCHKVSIVPAKRFVIRARLINNSKGINRQLLLVVGHGLTVGHNYISPRFIYTDFNELCGFVEGHTLDTSFTNTFFVSKIDTINRNIVGYFDIRVLDFKCTTPDTIRIS